MNTIIEITDEMFGQKSIPFNNPKVRYGARGIVKREDGHIAVFYKKAKNEYKLPGGGIDEKETPEQAFQSQISFRFSYRPNGPACAAAPAETEPQRPEDQWSEAG